MSAIVPPHTENFGSGAALPPRDYLDRLTRHLTAAEQAGATGAFAYDFPAAIDPWLAAFDVLACSALEPIVAVRPHRDSAEAVARRLLDLAYRFGRPAHVNLVSGATAAAREAADTGDKAAARRRLGQFAAELRAELAKRADPADPADPSNPAGPAAPLLITPSSSTPGVVPVDLVLLMARPRPALAGQIARIRAEQGVDRVALLVGVVARPTEEAAWAAAAEMFPEDRRKRVANSLFMAQVVSSEHQAAHAFGEGPGVQDERLWYGFPTFGLDAPKLVGSVEQVRGWLDTCTEIGVTDLIVDLPADPGEYSHLRPVLSP